jgi:hypothetical protein
MEQFNFLILISGDQIKKLWDKPPSSSSSPYYHGGHYCRNNGGSGDYFNLFLILILFLICFQWRFWKLF